MKLHEVGFTVVCGHARFDRDIHGFSRHLRPDRAPVVRRRRARSTIQAPDPFRSSGPGIYLRVLVLSRPAVRRSDTGKFRLGDPESRHETL